MSFQKFCQQTFRDSFRCFIWCDLTWFNVRWSDHCQTFTQTRFSSGKSSKFSDAMSSDTDSFDQILNRLSHLDRDKADDLNKLKKLVLSSSRDEIVAILDGLDLNEVNGVFRKLFKSSEKYIYEDLTDILNHILERLGSEEFYNRFDALIKQVLKSGDCPKLKAIYLKLLLACCKEVKVQNQIVSGQLNLIIESVGDPDEEVGKRSIDLLQYLSTKVDGFLDDHLFNASNLNLLQSVKNKNEIIKFRYFEFLVGLVLAKEAFLQNAHVRQAIKELLDLAKRPDDPLLVRNCLIILDKLLESDAGVEHLGEFGYFDLIASKITNPQSDLFVNLLMPGYLETFAKLGSTSPDLIQGHQAVIDQIVEFILAGGDFASCSIESIGLIGRLGKGKLVLNSNAKFTEQCLPKLGQLLKYGQTQVEVLNSLASLFDLNDLDATVDISNLLEAWYSKLSADRKQTRETIFALCKQAFPEIHLNSLNLIHKLAKHLWGQKELAQLSTFLDYILNRATEVDYKSKQAKFKLITELATSPFTKTAFGPMEHAKIRKVYQDGAFHVEADVTVAVEGAS